MNKLQRKVVFVVSMIMAPILFFAGLGNDNGLVGFGGPVLAFGVGVFVLVGGTRN